MIQKKNSAESSVEKIYDLIKDHITSLPEDEAMARLEIIDQAHAKARAQKDSPRRECGLYLRASVATAARH
ncbi:MAG TPA: hypothetical protein VG028_06795 [Terriglobia bacterium]|nr:hypothetical protein [Terriglobia bacterium]